jgi:ATP-dependent Clp protease protease subunit
MKRPQKPHNDDCGCDETTAQGESLRERIWANQLSQKQILISGPIDDLLIEKAVVHMFNFNHIDDQNEASIVGYEREPIYVLINSPGGNMDEAFSLIAAIEGSKTAVVTIALGKAMSAGFLILLAGHHRMCQKYTTLMYHQGSAGIIDSFGKMIEYAKHWEGCQDMVEEYVARQTKIKKKKLKEIFNSKTDWYIKPEDAKDLGIVHEFL